MIVNAGKTNFPELFWLEVENEGIRNTGEVGQNTNKILILGGAQKVKKISEESLYEIL